MSRTFIRLATAAFIVVGNLAHSITFACVAALLFIVDLIPGAAVYAWRMVVTIGVAAFRHIGQLKPVYRESYRTHGLSLTDAHPA